jgi:TPR repeat protein
MFYKGIGVTQSYQEAVKWYLLAAEQGNALAQYDLGLCYYNGQGVERDVDEAVNWFRLSAARGYNKAKELLNSIK